MRVVAGRGTRQRLIGGNKGGVEVGEVYIWGFLLFPLEYLREREIYEHIKRKESENVTYHLDCLAAGRGPCGYICYLHEAVEQCLEKVTRYLRNIT